MYASVHTDRSGRVFVSDDHRAAGSDGSNDVLLTGAIPLPEGARLVPLERDAEAFGRDGRIRSLGRGRLALSAILPAGHTRILYPSYTDDRSARALDPLPYAAVGADAAGEVVVAAARQASPAGTAPAGARAGSDITAALRSLPANTLLRQLARCARENECRAAHACLAGHDEIPVPLGAPHAERPPHGLALRSGYPGSPREPAAIHPSAADIEEVAADRLDRGMARVAFGRACEGEPLLALRVVEDAIARVRERSAGADIRLETTGCDAGALRRAIDAGLSGVTIRFASARPETYRLLHGPVSHAWADVRASIHVAVERGVEMTLALLVLPGITDRAAEMDAILALLGELPGGAIELRDLGADPERLFAAVPRGRPLGVRVLLDRLTEADHFRMSAMPDALGGEATLPSRGGVRPPAGTAR